MKTYVLTFATFLAAGVCAATPPVPCAPEPLSGHFELAAPHCARGRARVDRALAPFLAEGASARWSRVDMGGRFAEAAVVTRTGVWTVAISLLRDVGGPRVSEIRVAGRGATLTAVLGPDGRVESALGTYDAGGRQANAETVEQLVAILTDLLNDIRV